ncbi:MAG: hypothetical protein ACTJHU_05075, partial [Mycetocola sp.]
MTLSSSTASPQTATPRAWDRLAGIPTRVLLGVVGFGALIALSAGTVLGIQASHNLNTMIHGEQLILERTTALDLSIREERAAEAANGGTDSDPSLHPENVGSAQLKQQLRVMEMERENAVKNMRLGILLMAAINDAWLPELEITVDSPESWDEADYVFVLGDVDEYGNEIGDGTAGVLIRGSWQIAGPAPFMQLDDSHSRPTPTSIAFGVGLATATAGLIALMTRRDIRIMSTFERQ